MGKGIGITRVLRVITDKDVLEEVDRHNTKDTSTIKMELRYDLQMEKERVRPRAR